MNYDLNLAFMIKEQDFLDTIDLLSYLERDKSIFDIMDELEDKYGNCKVYKEEPFLFNCMCAQDFIGYLERRYPNIGFYEYSDFRVTRYY